MTQDPEVLLRLSMAEAWAVVTALECYRTKVRNARELHKATAQHVREAIETAYREHLLRREVGNA